MKFFSKNLKFFFDFLKIQRGDPVDLKKSKKNFKFFEKNFINKKCAYGPKMKPRQVLGKYFEVYGQLSPITPEAGKKRAPFFSNPTAHLAHERSMLGYPLNKAEKSKSPKLNFSLK